MTMLPDNPIDRTTINELNVDQLDTWLTAVRERRLHIVRKLEHIADIKHSTHLEDVGVKYVNELKRAQAGMVKIDAALATMEHRINRLRVMEIELS